MLDETLHEEKDTDETLNKLAASEINVNAANESDDQDGDDPVEIRKISAPRRKKLKHHVIQEPASE